MTQSTSKTRILFVCLGNICRSPMAEAIFLDLVNRRQSAERFMVESAGTSGHHAGENYHRETILVLERHDIAISGTSRPVVTADFENFDYLIAMDCSNANDLRSRCPAERFETKIRTMLEFQKEMYSADGNVPDPYYGGRDGFNEVFELLCDACEGLLEYLETSTKS